MLHSDLAGLDPNPPRIGSDSKLYLSRQASSQYRKTLSLKKFGLEWIWGQIHSTPSNKITAHVWPCPRGINKQHMRFSPSTGVRKAVSIAILGNNPEDQFGTRMAVEAGKWVRRLSRHRLNEPTLEYYKSQLSHEWISLPLTPDSIKPLSQRGGKIYRYLKVYREIK